METGLGTQRAPEDILDAEEKPRLLDTAKYSNHKQNNKQVLCTPKGIPDDTRSQEDVRITVNQDLGRTL